jgi:hypothetical protein
MGKDKGANAVDEATTIWLVLVRDVQVDNQVRSAIYESLKRFRQDKVSATFLNNLRQ